MKTVRRACMPNTHLSSFAIFFAYLSNDIFFNWCTICALRNLLQIHEAKKILHVTSINCTLDKQLQNTPHVFVLKMVIAVHVIIIIIIMTIFNEETFSRTWLIQNSIIII